MKTRNQPDGMLKIDKGIPIPNRQGDITATVNKMEIGDSVLVNTVGRMNTFRATITAHGFRPVSRRENQGWRIWKTQRN